MHEPHENGGGTEVEPIFKPSSVKGVSVPLEINPLSRVWRVLRFQLRRSDFILGTEEVTKANQDNEEGTAVSCSTVFFVTFCGISTNSAKKPLSVPADSDFI
jgi:hypothetical protein